MRAAPRKVCFPFLFSNLGRETNARRVSSREIEFRKCARADNRDFALRLISRELRRRYCYFADKKGASGARIIPPVRSRSSARVVNIPISRVRARYSRSISIRFFSADDAVASNINERRLLIGDEHNQEDSGVEIYRAPTRRY